MSNTNHGFRASPFPPIRRLMVDGGQLGRARHTVHFLVEADVSVARRVIREQKARGQEAVSFTGFIISCLGCALEVHKDVQAYRSWRDQVVVFDAVDVNTMFEVDTPHGKTVRPHILRDVNRKSPQELHREIRSFQAEHHESGEASFIRWFTRVPTPVRRLCLRVLAMNPTWWKELSGTVSVSSVGMFGRGRLWALPVPNHTLQVTIGGIHEAPAVVDGRLETREMLSLTISLDHDVVDGAPAARFIQTFRELIERGHGLSD